MPILHFVHDPMCSWCYAFAPTWRRIERALPASIDVRSVLGGLAPDTDEPMPDDTRAYIQSTWRRIQSVVPGTQFNFDFWTRCAPRRSTYPACRAVLTVRHLFPAREAEMVERIQRAYYLEARNPSDTATLCDIADRMGIDEQAFSDWMTSASCQALLERDIYDARALGVNAFPSLVLKVGDHRAVVPHDYNDALVTMSALERALQVIGPDQ